MSFNQGQVSDQTQPKGFWNSPELRCALLGARLTV
mgnify:CR=1 FL=1